jgi:protein-S-isoprenylcysteine O-methyltransferase Ste14
MSLRIIATVLLTLGALVVVCVYHFRMNRLHPGERERVTNWAFYAVVDWYLQISTLGLGLGGIVAVHPLLLDLHQSDSLMIAGLLLAGAGLILFLDAMRNLGRQYTPGHAAHLPTEIITAGPYRYIRHPVYAANLLMTAGVFLASGSLWLGLNLVILGIYYLFAMHSEEQSISDRYPEYRDYMNRTGRLFPRAPGFFRKGAAQRTALKIESTSPADHAEAISTAK